MRSPHDRRGLARAARKRIRQGRARQFDELLALDPAFAFRADVRNADGSFPCIVRSGSVLTSKPASEWKPAFPPSSEGVTIIGALR